MEPASPEKSVFLDLGQELYTMNLEHFEILESKKVPGISEFISKVSGHTLEKLKTVKTEASIKIMFPIDWKMAKVLKSTGS